MPTISFCFQGWVTGYDVQKIYETTTGNQIDVSDKSSQELIDSLNRGDCALSLDEALKSCTNCSVEIHDYEESK
jgi:hypothetical protein